MSIEGRIAIDVNFADSATSDGVQSLKKISLTDTTSYTTGKVAIVTGTCGTAGVSVSQVSPGYVNAAGETVTFSNVARVAFKSPEGAYVVQGVSTFLRSKGDLSVDNQDQVTTSLSYSVRAFEGTASYTLVLYGT